jgi:SAM-dependent methyltransferase
MRDTSSGQSSSAKLPSSRRLLRRIKSAILQSEAIYRLYLKGKFGTGGHGECPAGPLPNWVLQRGADWEEATRKGRQLGLPLHRASEKNWDHLAAVYAIVGACPRSGAILDAGAEFYSNVLPALYVCGYRRLYGINLSFTDKARRGPIEYLPGDITRTSFADGFFDAITCMSVIEHGVPLRPYFEEMLRLLKPGGILITSTDYFEEPIDTTGRMAHGAPVKVFSRREIEEMLKLAEECGFELTGPVELSCTERPIRWEVYDLDYTFLIFTLRKQGA